MSDAPDFEDRPNNDQDVEDLRDSATEMGVDDADERDPDEVVDEVRHAQADSETSPSEWRSKSDD